VTNAGGASVNIAGIAVAGDFAETDTCDTKLEAFQTCVVSVTFVPTGSGPTTGSLTLTDNASNSPQVINLSGKGNNGKGH